MMMPSIALPTGPYDLPSAGVGRAQFEQRIEALRAIMTARGITHCVVHGNGFDHAGLSWLANFTPKLGPAWLLVTLEGLRMLFAGGPGMKPSAQRLTFIEDVAALRGIEKDAQQWLAQNHAPLGLIAGRAMLRRDWLAVERAAQGRIVMLDEDLQEAMAADEQSGHAALDASLAVLRIAAQTLYDQARAGASQREAVLTMERAAYGTGAQDVRIRMARRVWGAPVTLPDEDTPITGPLPVVLAVRSAARWTWGRFVIGPVGRDLLERAGATRPDAELLAMDNAVGVGDAPAREGAVAQALIRLADEPQAIWSLIVDTREHERRILWSPPGLSTTSYEWASPRIE